MERKIYHDVMVRLMAGQNMPQQRRRGGITITPKAVRVIVVDEPDKGSGIVEITPGDWEAIRQDSEKTGLISFTVNGSVDPNAPEIAAMIAKLAKANQEIDQLKRECSAAGDEVARLRIMFESERNEYRAKLDDLDGRRLRAEGQATELRAQIGLAAQKVKRV